MNPQTNSGIAINAFVWGAITAGLTAAFADPLIFSELLMPAKRTEAAAKLFGAFMVGIGLYLKGKHEDRPAASVITVPAETRVQVDGKDVESKSAGPNV